MLTTMTEKLAFAGGTFFLVLMFELIGWLASDLWQEPNYHVYAASLPALPRN